MLCIASVFVRYHTAREVERRQLKWLLVGALATVALLAIALAVGNPGWALALSSLALPAAVVVANPQRWPVGHRRRRQPVARVQRAACRSRRCLRGGRRDARGRTRAHHRRAARGHRDRRTRREPGTRAWLGNVANRFVYGYRDDPAAVLHELSDRLDAAAAEDVVQRAAETLTRVLRLQSVEVVPAADDGSTAGERFPLVYQGREVGALVVRPPADCRSPRGAGALSSRCRASSPSSFTRTRSATS